MLSALIEDLTAKDCVCRWPRFACGIVSLLACMPSICGGKQSRGFPESMAVLIVAESPAQEQPDKSCKEAVLLKRSWTGSRCVGRTDLWLLLHVSTCINEVRKLLAVLDSHWPLHQRQLTPRAALAVGIDPLRILPKLQV